MQKNTQAFTLVELLVVVLIIGILSAVALPMYQGAVDKSHWSTMLPGAKAVKNAEEAIKMTNGAYTDEMANLDVTMNNSDLTFNLVTPNNTADPNVIRVTNSKLANVRLASYLDQSPMFAGQLHCEALKNDERANRLCGKLLMGEELTSADGYTGYLLDQDITKEICGNASRSWSSSKTKCYKSDTERCTTLGNMGVLSEGQCGFENEQSKTIKAEGTCLATEYAGCEFSKLYDGGSCEGAGGFMGCAYSNVYAGGICIGKAGAGPCNFSQVYAGGTCQAQLSNSCTEAHIRDGGVCQGIGCYHAYIHNGGKCIPTSSSGCQGATYEGTGCCEDYGKGFCGNAPKC